MSAIVGLDHVQIAAPVGCEPAARQFYGELLGLPEIAKPRSLASRGGAWFACGAQALHVGVEDAFAPARKAHPGLRVVDAEDLDALAGRLEESGLTVTWDDSIAGVRRFYVDDPFGNRIELTTAGRLAG